jgi:CheY-like chemotaxis protein
MIKNILAVDDSAAMRQILSATFVAAGYRVVVALDGAQAYEAALAEQFDLVITDQNMPAMSGLELIGKLRGTSCVCEYADPRADDRVGRALQSRRARSRRDGLARKAVRP